MRAIVMNTFGGPEVMTVREVDDIGFAANEVLIQVVAAGINRADLRQREGFYPPPSDASTILGLECSGRIVALGADVDGWAIGDEVCALLAGGGYAEQAAVRADQLLPVPDGVNLHDAAALPEVFATVWSTVFMMAGLAAGETLLVHGGASGIGTAAIQLAVARGARVLVTVGTEEKRLRCTELGASVAINYRTHDFVEQVGLATNGLGVDVILDPIGGSYTQRDLLSLNRGGRIVCLGIQEDPLATFDIRTLMAKRASLMGATLRSRPPEEKAEIMRGVYSEVWPLIGAGVVAPVVDRSFPMEEVAEAHRVVAASEHVGKVLIEISSGAPGDPR